MMTLLNSASCQTLLNHAKKSPSDHLMQHEVWPPQERIVEWMGHLPLGERVVVAMSGGVDSSVVASLLHRAGYEVVGVTMQLYNAATHSKGCCATKDIYDAKNVAAQEGFAHYILDYEHVFERDVIKPFVAQYGQGFTPIPCASCNQTVKFRDLLAFCQDVQGKALVTGHYILQEDDRLYAASDLNKDQSYFLFSLTAEQRKLVRFPLGRINKSTTRQLANIMNLDVSQKADSQDICFVPDEGYTAVIARHAPEYLVPGPIFNQLGENIGTHQGIAHYTIGQRRRLGISSTESLFVLSIDAERNALIVGPKSALAQKSCFFKNISLEHHRIAPLCNLDLQETRYPATEKKLYCRVRSAGPFLRVSLKTQDHQTYEAILDEPQYGIAPGQACVVYAYDKGRYEMLGGGWIYKK